jgi:flavodoxin
MKLAIVTASQNGATQKVAQIIADTLQEEYGIQATFFDPKRLAPGDIMEYEIWLIGSSTWGNGDLHRDMDQLERSLRDVAIFPGFGELPSAPVFRCTPIFAKRSRYWKIG